MLKIKASTKALITFLIFAISMFAGLYQAGIILKKEVKFEINKDDLETTTSFFVNAGNIRKIRMTIAEMNLNKTTTDLDEIINQFNLNQLIVIRKPEYRIYTLELPDSISYTVMDKLREMGNITDENLTSGNISEQNTINIKERIRINEAQKRKYEELRESSKYDITIKSIGEQIYSIQTRIDSLKNLSEQINKTANTQLVQITLMKAGRDSLSMVTKVKKLVFTSLAAFAGLMVLAIFFYLFLMLIFRIMDLLGLKTKKETSRYGYDSYSRRSKKVYVNPDDRESDKK